MVTTKIVTLSEAINIQYINEQEIAQGKRIDWGQIIANNKGIIRCLRDNHERFKHLIVGYSDSSYHEYCLMGNGWLGLEELGDCIGKNQHLQNVKLYIDLCDDVPDEDATMIMMNMLIPTRHYQRATRI